MLYIMCITPFCMVHAARIVSEVASQHTSIAAAMLRFPCLSAYLSIIHARNMQLWLRVLLKASEPQKLRLELMQCWP